MTGLGDDGVAAGFDETIQAGLPVEVGADFGGAQEGTELVAIFDEFQDFVVVLGVTCFGAIQFRLEELEIAVVAVVGLLDNGEEIGLLDCGE